MSFGEETKKAERGGIVCAGNLIVDRVHTLSYWPEEGNLAEILHQDVGVGGGAVNVACDLASLGLPARVALAGLTGADADGDLLAQRVAAAGVNIAAVQRTSEAATSHTHVMSLPGRSRTFFYHGGASARLNADTIDPAQFAGAGYRLFYLGYLMLLPGLDRLDGTGRTGASRLLERAKASGLETAVDFVSSENPDFAAEVSASLPWCDHAIINEVEAGRVAQLPLRKVNGHLDLQLMQHAAETLIELGVRKNVVIHAPELSLWQSVNDAPLITRSLRVPPEKIVSPVGAGDAFCATTLFGLHEGWSREKTAAIAHRAAAHCLTGATATDGIPTMDVLLKEREENA
ncbi:carbohydrate kinase family protein [Rhizobium sp. C4]|uniref:carbohydrate kinase family protein n=1 Tax=Rhizobium sp. C4 TaxID=1349800 RepID=UPI001E55EB35|nr:carbohydrate kinase family protein [Rhizobium sp. C4]MCD2172433.1 carbohydrate kinase family protein [Rhizobium sp. C4]